MGYVTDWEVKVLPGTNEDHPNVIAELSKISRYDFTNSGILCDAKWYDVEQDLATLTRIFPNVVIVVDADGEEKGDVYRIYAHQGSVEFVNPVITWSEPEWVADTLDQVKIEAELNKEKEERETLRILAEKYNIALPEELK